MNLKPGLLLSTLLSFSLLPGTTYAVNGTLSGQIGVQVTISGGCIVGNGDSSGSTNKWGNINFGTYADLSSIINGSSIGSAAGGNALTIKCTSDLDPHLQLDGGMNETAKNVRAMINQKTTIPYRLYSDAAYSQEITPNSSISITHDDQANNVVIYGRILPSDQTPGDLSQGVYTDTVTATLTW